MSMTELSDVDFFLKGNPQDAVPALVPAEFTASGRSEIRINFMVGNEERNYKAEHFLDVLDTYNSERINSDKDNFKKRHLAENGRYILRHYIEVFDDWMKSANEPKESYDFQSLINRANNYIECLDNHIGIDRSKLEYSKLYKEVHFWKDPRYWAGVGTGLIPLIVKYHGQIIATIHRLLN